MNDRINVATAEATALYPAVTVEELNNDALLLSNYRRSLGRERMLWGGIVVITGAWLVHYLRGSK